MSKNQKKETGKPICKLKPEEQVLSGDGKYINPKRLLQNAPASALVTTPKKNKAKQQVPMFGGIPLK